MTSTRPAPRRRCRTCRATAPGGRSSERRPSSSSRSRLINILSTGADALSAILAIGGSLLFVAILTLNTQVPDEAGFFGLPRAGDPVVAPGRLTTVTSFAVVALIAIAVADSIHRPDTGWFAFFYFASTAASTVRNGRLAIGLMVVAGVAPPG